MGFGAEGEAGLALKSLPVDAEKDLTDEWSGAVREGYVY